MQWADASSLSLLFYLSQRLRDLPIFFITAYRTSEATEGAGLAKLSNEFKRLYGEVTLDLDKVAEEEREVFVNALLDSEDNQFNEQFRKALVDKTGGHPLFALELLKSLEVKGQLRPNQEGKWIMTTELSDFDLPVRVEAVIAERMQNIPPELQDILSTASVEGERFTVELIADLQNKKIWEVVQALSTLDKKHQIIKLQGFKELADERLTHYSFRHQLFQDYLYKQLSESEQSFLHGQVGSALAKLAPEGHSELSLQLAQHFQAAGQMNRALQHWQGAADYAEQLAAYLEAISYIKQALELLDNLPPEQSVSLEVYLQLRLGDLLGRVKGWAAPEVEKTFSRAYALCENLNQSEVALPLLGLCNYHQTCADYETAIELGDKLIQIVKHNPQVNYSVFSAQGWNHLFQGNLVRAKEFFEKGNNLYNRKELHPEGYNDNLSGMAWALAMMGLEDEASEYLAEALSLSEQIGEPFHRSMVHTYAWLYQFPLF